MIESHSPTFLRKAGIIAVSWLLGLFLFVAAGAMVISFVAGDPATVKNAIAQSGAYDHLIENSLNTALESVDKKNTSDIPLNDPIIRDSLVRAYSPTVIRTNSEKLIDGTYRWLDGSAAQPDFVLDFSASNDLFIEEAGKRLESRLRGLPPCTAQQLSQQQKMNAFKATCVPPGIDITPLIQQAKSNLRSSKNLLPDNKITADTFKQAGESQNVFVAAGNAPRQFQLLKQIPWILLGLTVIFALLVVFLYPVRDEGIKRLGRILTINGVMIIMIALGLYFVQAAIGGQKATGTNQLSRDLTLPILAEFAKAAAKVYLIFGAVTVLIGGPIWVVARKRIEAEELRKEQ